MENKGLHRRRPPMLTLDKAQAITRAMPSLSPPQLRVVSLLSKLKGPIRFFPGLTRANSELTVLLDMERGERCSGRISMLVSPAWNEAILHSVGSLFQVP